MKFKVSDFDQLFDPLVGDKDAQRTFKGNLSNLVRVGYGNEDPYGSLLSGYRGIVAEVLRDLNTPGSRAEDVAQRERIILNAQVTGSMAVAMLRTVGGIYRNHTLKTGIKQEADSVHANTNRSLRILLGMAFNSDEPTLSDNFEALKFGLDPSSRVARPIARLYNRLQPKDAPTTRFSPRSLQVSVVERGQIDIRPRFKLSHLGEQIHCPAAMNMVPGPNHRQSAIFAVMDALAAVTQERIYPQQFLIESRAPGS